MDPLYSLLIAAAVIIFVGAIAIFSIESVHPDSQIDSMLDAIWWTVATVTTVGYGDIVLVTDTGRIVAIFYMFFGISVLAMLLSVLGTRFYKRKFENEEKEFTHAQKLILQRFDELENNQKNLEKNIKEILERLKQKED
ncbi:MAG: ion channel [Nitrosopumilus sp.]|uniref:ion channel n=1 Tax=Nitrosopumilus sp. TaxID=2024843 RepID=UPI00292D36DB|nr:ion channel [Nitrosopumilus sp.]